MPYSYNGIRISSGQTNPDLGQSSGASDPLSIIGSDISSQALDAPLASDITSQTLSSVETSSEKSYSADIPDSLGTMPSSSNQSLTYAESLRENSNNNGMVTVNHRFRGHREAYKFNLLMQKILTACGNLFLILRQANNRLTEQELNSVYPTETEVALITHIREQVRFKEWLLLKDDNQKWFI